MDFRTNDRNYYYAILSVTQQSQSADANTSTLAYKLTLYAGNTWFRGYALGYSVKIDGTQVAYHDNTDDPSSMTANTSLLVTSGTASVLHDDDGRKTVAVEAEIWTKYHTGLPVYLACSGTMELTQILRESAISATDANIGATAMIAVARRSAAYTHSIAYSFGALSGYLLADGTMTDTETKLTATYIGWTLPESFYAQIPDAKSGKVTLTCRTYNGDTQLGNDRTATFRAIAAEDVCAPTVSGTVQDTNAATVALTGDASKLVRFKSTATCTITAAAKNAATLAEKRIAGEAVTGDTREIANVESDSFAFVAVDSRGYTASAVVQRTIIPYIKLTARATAERVGTASGQVKLTISGSVFTGSFGAVTNTLTIKYRIDNSVDWTVVEATAADGAYSAETIAYDVGYNQAHTLQVSVSDKLETVTVSGQIKRGIPVFDWGEGDFNFNVPVYFPAGAKVDSNGRVVLPGIDSAWRTARDKAGVRIGYGGAYTPALSMKSTDCTWDIATYNNRLEITKFADATYDDGSNTPAAEFTFGEDGIAGLQTARLVASGVLSSSNAISGTGDMRIYRTVYILFGETLQGNNQYYTFVCPYLASDFWGIYLPSANDYYRARVDMDSSGKITVSMLSAVTRSCYIYVGM